MSEHAVVDSNAAAAFLGVAKQTLARWRVEGGGPPFLKLGALVRYDTLDLEVWLQAQRRSSTSDHGPSSAA